VLVEVPVMLSVCNMCNRTQGWHGRVATHIVAQAAHLRQTTQEKLNELRQENERLQHQIAKGFRPDHMVGNSNAMRSVYLHIE
jgi:transcriptional regulator with GAF, ATPase, and Fis domain